MKTLLGKLLRDRRGATAIEYGLIMALVVLVMLVALQAVARSNLDIWSNVSNKVVNA